MAEHVMPIRAGTPIRRAESADDERPAEALDEDQRAGIDAARERARRLEQRADGHSD